MASIAQSLRRKWSLDNSSAQGDVTMPGPRISNDISQSLPIDAGEEMKESVQSADSSHPLLAACRSVSLPAGRYVPTFSSPGNDAEGSPSRGFSMPLFSMGSFKPRHSEESGVSASTEAAESPNAHSAPITIQHSSAAKRNLSGALDDAAMASSTVGNTTPESSLASAATPPPRRSRDDELSARYREWHDVVYASSF